MGNFREYLGEARKELKKVTWPNRPKVMETSLVVGICTAIFAGYLWAVDIGIYQVFRVLFY